VLQAWLIEEPTWYRVNKWSRVAGALADRHYSRQTHGSDQVLAPGRTLLMVTPDEAATWGVVHNLDPVGNERWRCSIFRNEGGQLSSDLIGEATAVTFDYWPRRYGSLPRVPLTTEVDPNATRRKRDPGRCFARAGWQRWSWSDLVVLHAPGERARVNLQGPVLR